MADGPGGCAGPLRTWRALSDIRSARIVGCPADQGSVPRCCPGPSWMSKPRSRRSGRSVTMYAIAARPRSAYTLRFDGVDLASTRVPAAALAGALTALAPDLRAALEETVRRRPPGLPGPAAAGRVRPSIGAGATVTERTSPWAGRACTCRGARSPGPVLGADERGPRPGRRGRRRSRWPRRRRKTVCPARRCSPRARCSDRRGRRRGGAQAIAMLGYGTADCAAGTLSPARATSTWRRPSGCCSARSARRRGRPDEITIIAD